MMLNADELGEKGQKHFGEICADAKLTCNQSDRDRKGWDFIVEFPFGPEDSGTTSYDKRSVPISYHVQVKTVLADTKSVKLRLSSAEWLAKEPKPSFIYVFRIKDGGYQESVLIHLMDDNLSKVLKRLRAEARDKRHRLNRRSITFNLSRCGTRISSTGDALRAAIAQHCRDGMDAYMRSKAEQLRTLGFGPRPITIKTTLKAPSYDSLVAAFLGRGEIEALNFAATENRFGIDLPIEQPQSAILRIEPHAADTCTIRFRHPGLKMPATFSGDIVLPGIPNLDPDYFQALIRSAIFEMTVIKQSFTLKIREGALQNTRLGVDEWANYARLGLIMELGNGSAEVTLAKLSRSIRFSLNANPDGDVRRFEYVTAVCDGLRTLVELAGATQEKFSLSDILAAGDDILLITDHKTPKTRGHFLEFTPDSAYVTQLWDGIEFLDISFLSVGQCPLAYWGVISMGPVSQSDIGQWRSKTFDLREVAFLPHFPDGYEQFTIRAKRASGNDRFVMFTEPTKLETAEGSVKAGTGSEPAPEIPRRKCL